MGVGFEKMAMIISITKNTITVRISLERFLDLSQFFRLYFRNDLFLFCLLSNPLFLKRLTSCPYMARIFLPIGHVIIIFFYRFIFTECLY